MDLKVAQLPERSPSAGFELVSWSFGSPAGVPHVHIQAGLHANEIPPFLVVAHLRQLLIDAERAGQLQGRITVVPVANPIGLAQRFLGRPQGRYDLADGVNFNRDFPDLAEATASFLEAAGGESHRHAIRCALISAIEAEQPRTTTQALKLALLREAAGADIILDFHSAVSGVVHVVTQETSADGLQDLAAAIQAEVILTVPRDKPSAFDESVVYPEFMLASRYPKAGIAVPVSATIELRGNRDVSDELAAEDAAGILAFLRARKVVSVGAPVESAPSVQISPSGRIRSVDAPTPGVVILNCRPGDRVAADDIVAELVDPASTNRTALKAGTDGLVLIAQGEHFAVRGASIVQIVPSG